MAKYETVGLDTGFFIKLLEGNEEAVKIWTRILDGELNALTSSLVLFELRRIFIKLGKGEEWEDIKNAIILNCEVIPIDIKVAEEGALVSHGTGLPTVDVLIYTSIMNADRFYTTDSSFKILRKKKKPRVVML